MYTKLIYNQYRERLIYRQIRTAKRILDKLTDIEIPVLLIHGNTETFETKNWIYLYTRRHNNMHWIADDAVQIGKYVFIGYGWVDYDNNYDRIPSEGELPIEDAEVILNKTIEKAKKKYPMAKKFILISHAPPYGTPLDVLPKNKRHAGSKNVKKLIDNNTIIGVISGHIHESPGFYMQNKIFAINAGAIIEDTACIYDTDTNKVQYIHNVIRKAGISYPIYRLRSLGKLDKTRKKKRFS